MSSLHHRLETDLAGVFWDLYKRGRDTRIARRYHAMAVLCDLTPVDEVATILHVHPDTILNWIERYNEGGIMNLVPSKHAGRPSKLSDAQMELLISDILTPPRKLGYKFSNWDGKRVRYRIKERFDIELTRSGVYALLHRINFRLVTPRAALAKADKKKDRSL